MRLPFILCLLTATASSAATIFTSVSTDDAVNNANCTLREAIIAANTDTARDLCRAGAGADLIVMTSGTYLLAVLGANEDASVTGDLDVISNVTIVGAGAARTSLNSSAVSERAFEVRPGAALVLRGLTILGGSVTGGSQRGGGVQCGLGELTVIETQFDANAAATAGGAIYSDTCGVVVDRSTFNNNSSSQGGAISTERSTLYVTNSTFRGNNVGTGIGSAIQSVAGGNSGFAHLEHLTIQGNVSAVAAVRNTTGAGGSPRMQVLNCLVSDTPAFSNNGGILLSFGGNVVADATLPTTGGDQQNVATTGLLGAFGRNGGQTMIFPLTPTSPGIDSLTVGSCASVDQRGVARPSGNGCEPGAVELYAYPALFALTVLTPGGPCGVQGGVRLDSGRDDGRGAGSVAGNGVLETNEVTQTSNVCNGVNGTSCSVSTTPTGANISCSNGTNATVTNGTNGVNGTSCSVAQTATGATISCTDATSATVMNGDAGTSCSVSQTASGATISCSDGTSAVVSDGANGDAGANGMNGTNGTNGTDGMNGMNGMSGADGMDGINGSNGMAGMAGMNGMNGKGCTVVENADGSATITCPDGTTATVGGGASNGCGCTSGGGLGLVVLLALALKRQRR